MMLGNQRNKRYKIPWTQQNDNQCMHFVIRHIADWV